MSRSFLARVYVPPRKEFFAFVLRAWPAYFLASSFIQIPQVIREGGGRPLPSNKGVVGYWWDIVTQHPEAAFTWAGNYLLHDLYVCPLWVLLGPAVGVWLVFKGATPFLRVSGAVLTAGSVLGAGWVGIGIAGTTPDGFPMFAEPVVGSFGLGCALILLFRGPATRRFTALLPPVALFSLLAVHAELFRGPIWATVLVLKPGELLASYMTQNSHVLEPIGSGLYWTMAVTSILAVWFAPLVITRGMTLGEAGRALLSGVRRRPLLLLLALVLMALQGLLVYPAVSAFTLYRYFIEGSLGHHLGVTMLILATASLLLSVHVLFVSRMGSVLADSNRPG